MIVQQNTGTMFSRIFAFSTCVTVQSFHGLGFSDSSGDEWMAALSKKLKKK